MLTTCHSYCRYFNTHKGRARTGSEVDPAVKKKKGKGAAKDTDDAELGACLLASCCPVKEALPFHACWLPCICQAVSRLMC